MFKKIIIASLFSVSFFSCSSDSESDITETTTEPITYTNTIKDIITQGCATSGCHNSITKQSGLDLALFEVVKTSFQATGSNSAIGRIESGDMPRSASRFSTSTVNIIKEWIDADFPE